MIGSSIFKEHLYDLIINKSLPFKCIADNYTKDSFLMMSVLDCLKSTKPDIKCCGNCLEFQVLKNDRLILKVKNPKSLISKCENILGFKLTGTYDEILNSMYTSGLTIKPIVAEWLVDQVGGVWSPYHLSEFRNY